MLPPVTVDAWPRMSLCSMDTASLTCRSTVKSVPCPQTASSYGTRKRPRGCLLAH